MDTRFTLSQIVDAVLGSSGGSVKTAQAVCEKCGKPAMADSKLCRECADRDLQKSENEETGAPAESEKTSSARVVKLAGAIEYIVLHPENIHPVLGRIKVAEAPPEVAKLGPGKGPNTVTTNLMDALAGEQSTISGEAKTKIPMQAGTAKAIPGDKQPANAMEDNLRDMKGPYPEEGPLKQASFRERYIRLMRKKASDAESPASLASGKSTVLPENQPDLVKRPAEVTSQERLISTNQGAIDITKREAKEVPKKRMAEVISEPAQTSSTDKILDENLGAKVVDEAGAKVAFKKTAAARALLKKVASGGCVCNGQGTCGHCKVASRLKLQRNGQ